LHISLRCVFLIVCELDDSLADAETCRFVKQKKSVVFRPTSTLCIELRTQGSVRRKKTNFKTLSRENLQLNSQPRQKFKNNPREPSGYFMSPYGLTLNKSTSCQHSVLFGSQNKE